MRRTDMWTGKNAGGQRAAMLLALLAALLVAQLANAAHQFDHLATDIADPCVECLQLDRNDDVVLPGSAGPALPDSELVQRVHKTRSATPSPAPVVRSRGPPLA